MASAYGAYGLSTGFNAGLRDARARQRQAQEDAIAEEDRKRRIAREDEILANSREDRAYNVGLRELQQKERTDQQLRATQALENEGMADLLDGLLDGEDPALVLDTYNRRGTHKIDPKGFKYDPATKTMQVVGPDGVPKQVSALEARKQLARLMTDSNAPRAEPKQYHYKDDELVKDAAGNVIHKGPKYGVSNEKPPGLMSTADGIYDPVTKSLIKPPAGAGGRGGTRGGTNRSPFNLQGEQERARKVLGDRIGMKFDKDGFQVIERDKNGKPIVGQSERWSNLSAETDSLVSKYEDTVGAAQVANTVADAFDEMPSLQERIADVLKDDERQTKIVDGRPVRESKAEQLERVTKDAKRVEQVDRQTRREQADKQLAAMSQETLRNRGAELEQEAPPAAPGANRPGRGATARDVLTPDKVTGRDQEALGLLRSNPTLLTALLRKPSDPKKLVVVKFPQNGKAYILAGNELREVQGFKTN